ncbi:hypothetical protein BJ875DRAFT_485394 [Amylocarpus encephaloides]|uniref:Myb-like domain-containing protein n=1 Tax=Amylocarpus encephaloides TaxID=45428 RepID=A0A9P7YG75_9HELO|nr:hypothetical protein BJ875DRAFT_485394 [Amylocarpus encephaloides]
MAALKSTKFVRFALPPSNPPFCNSNTFWPTKTGGSIPSLTSSQKARRPAATLSRSGCQAEAERNTAARAEGGEPTSANRLGERQGDNPDQPVILDDNELDEAEGASVDIETGCLERDPSPYNISATSEPVLGPIKSIDTSGPWYDVEEGCYIDEPAPRLGPHEQYSIPSAPAQAQPQTLPQSSAPQQDQTNEQGVGSIARNASVELALHSLPKPFDRGDDGWTDESIAELEKELGLALEEEQVESPFAGAPSSPSPRSVEAPQDEIQSRERSKTTGGILEELRDASRRCNSAQDLELWEQRETQVVVEGGAVAMQQQEELAVQKEELGQPAVGDQQDEVEVDNADDPEDKEATEALPAAQPKIPEIDEHRFRLRGVRARQFAGRQIKTTQYRIISMPCEPYSQDLALQVDIFRVCGMRSSLRKGRKVFEYLVNIFGLDSRTWTTEDQLRISLNPMLVAELKASSPHPLSEAQREVLLRHSATPISDKYHHVSRVSRSSSAPADTALEGEPPTRKRGHQDVRTEISSNTYHSANIDDNHDACDTGDEDPRPAKRRKPRAALTVTSTISQRHTPELHVGQPGPLVALSTAIPEIDDAHPQVDHECLSTFVDNSHQYASRTPRSPSVAPEAVPVAEYREWPFQGFLKRTRIGDDVTYNLEFKLPSISEHLQLSIDSKALDICSSKEAPAKASTHHDAAAHTKIHRALSKPKKSKVPWTEEEDAKLLRMWNEGRSWEYIFAALPNRSEGSIRVRCSTKFKKRPRTGAGRY